MTQNPFTLFAEWFALAIAAPHISEPSAMCLATSTREGKPSARMVLLKEWDERGFTFYTNMKSRKGEEITANAQVALSFFWDMGTRENPKQRQVRIEGKAVRVSDKEADAYYTSRPLQSRIGAWASEQSKPLDSEEALTIRYKEFEKKFGENPSRPPHWSGWRIAPQSIEFWTQGNFRMHERRLFTMSANGWKETRLNP